MLICFIAVVPGKHNFIIRLTTTVCMKKHIVIWGGNRESLGVMSCHLKEGIKGAEGKGQASLPGPTAVGWPWAWSHIQGRIAVCTVSVVTWFIVVAGSGREEKTKRCLQLALARCTGTTELHWKHRAVSIAFSLLARSSSDSLPSASQTRDQRSDQFLLHVSYWCYHSSWNGYSARFIL